MLTNLNLIKSKIFFISIVCLTYFIVPLLSQKVGISCDENLHNIHGQLLFDFFSGKSDVAQRSPLDSDNNIILVGVNATKTTPNIHGLNSFGGTFDLICQIVIEITGTTKVYETRHIVNSVFGVTLFLVLAFIALQLRKDYILASICFCMLAVSPRILGHSFYNPKDIPFALFYALSILQLIMLLRKFPVFSWKNGIALAVFTGLAFDIRVGAIIIILLMLFALPSRLFVYLSKKRLEPSDYALIPKYIMYFFGLVPLSLILCVPLWPFMHVSFPNGLFKLIAAYSKFSGFNSYPLFEGSWVNRWEIPWYYEIKWFWIATPIFIFIGLLLLVCGLLWWNFRKNMSLQAFCLVGLGAFMPLSIQIICKSNVYDDFRHLMFAFVLVYPISAYGIYASSLLIKKRTHQVFIFSLTYLFLLFDPGRFLIQNYPYYFLYFSPMVGGSKGAFQEYEFDFFISSYRQMVEYVHENIHPDTNRKIRIRMTYGETECINYFLHQKPGYELLFCEENSTDWDYWYYTNSSGKFNHEIIKNWPPPNAVKIFYSDGAPWGCIIKNPRIKF